MGPTRPGPRPGGTNGSATGDRTAGTDGFPGSGRPRAEPGGNGDDASSARPGRPRSAACDRAIQDATLDALARDGYAGLSVEGVASRAGVGKATIYRRWPTKSALVVEAVRAYAFEHVPLVDTGDVRADLGAMLGALQESMRRDAPLLRTFCLEAARHPDLADAWRRGFLAQKREALREALRRAVERGQLPQGTDVELLADAGPALMWHRLTVLGDEPPADLPARIIAQFLPPARP